MPEDENQNPLISILMTCYNDERFVGEALEGVLAQTYRPLHIVIVDDCSTDGTTHIIQAKLAERTARTDIDITFIRNPKNLNPFGAVRVGLAAAKGSFIMLSSSDDIMLPNLIEEVAACWIAENVSLVTTNLYYIDENSKLLNRTHRDPNERADDSFETLARDGANACCFGAAMGFEREVYELFGWPPDYLGAADIMIPFYAHLLKGARFLEKPLLKYRVHSSNSSLSLIAEKQDKADKLLTNERIFVQHIAHALLMQDELTRLAAEQPDRYSEIASRTGPLLTTQTIEMARKLVKTRIELQQLGEVLDVKKFGRFQWAARGQRTK